MKLSKDDKIVRYKVVPSAEEKSMYRANLLKQYGNLEPSEEIKEDDFIIVDLEQPDMKIEGTYLSLRSLNDDKLKNEILGKKAGESFEMNVNEAFKDEGERANFLKAKKEDLGSLNPVFKVTVKEIKTFVEAKPVKETFDRIFGEGKVNNEEEFDKEVEKRLVDEYGRESDYRFMLDARNYLMDKAAIKLPEDFLKRWIFTTNDGKFTMEEIEKDFPLFLKDFRWQLVRQYIMKENNISVNKEDMVAEAKNIASYQFAMYGLPNVPEDQLKSYAESMLKNENEARRVFEKVESDKTLDYVKTVVTIEEKEIGAEELRKLTE